MARTIETNATAERVQMTVGRDYQPGHHGYEYVLMTPAEGVDNWDVLARKGFFMSASAARRAGLKAGVALLAPTLPGIE